MLVWVCVCISGPFSSALFNPRTRRCLLAGPCRQSRLPRLSPWRGAPFGSLQALRLRPRSGAAGGGPARAARAWSASSHQGPGSAVGAAHRATCPRGDVQSTAERGSALVVDGLATRVVLLAACPRITIGTHSKALNTRQLSAASRGNKDCMKRLLSPKCHLILFKWCGSSWLNGDRAMMR